MRDGDCSIGEVAVQQKNLVCLRSYSRAFAYIALVSVATASALFSVPSYGSEGNDWVLVLNLDRQSSNHGWQVQVQIDQSQKLIPVDWAKAEFCVAHTQGYPLTPQFTKNNPIDEAFARILSDYIEKTTGRALTAYRRGDCPYASAPFQFYPIAEWNKPNTQIQQNRLLLGSLAEKDLEERILQVNSDFDKEAQSHEKLFSDLEQLAISDSKDKIYSFTLVTISQQTGKVRVPERGDRGYKTLCTLRETFQNNSADANTVKAWIKQNDGSSPDSEVVQISSMNDLFLSYDSGIFKFETGLKRFVCEKFVGFAKNTLLIKTAFEKSHPTQAFTVTSHDSNSILAAGAGFKSIEQYDLATQMGVDKYAFEKLANLGISDFALFEASINEMNEIKYSSKTSAEDLITFLEDKAAGEKSNITAVAIRNNRVKLAQETIAAEKEKLAQAALAADQETQAKASGELAGASDNSLENNTISNAISEIPKPIILGIASLVFAAVCFLIFKLVQKIVGAIRRAKSRAKITKAYENITEIGNHAEKVKHIEAAAQKNSRSSITGFDAENIFIEISEPSCEAEGSWSAHVGVLNYDAYQAAMQQYRIAHGQWESAKAQFEAQERNTYEASKVYKNGSHEYTYSKKYFEVSSPSRPSELSYVDWYSRTGDCSAQVNFKTMISNSNFTIPSVSHGDVLINVEKLELGVNYTYEKLIRRIFEGSVKVMANLKALVIEPLSEEALLERLTPKVRQSLLENAVGSMGEYHKNESITGQTIAVKRNSHKFPISVVVSKKGNMEVTYTIHDHLFPDIVIH